MTSSPNPVAQAQPTRSLLAALEGTPYRKLRAPLVDVPAHMLPQ